jgi:hypothetical protein
MVAYIDVFMLMMLIVAVTIPLLLMIRTGAKRQNARGGVGTGVPAGRAG